MTDSKRSAAVTYATRWVGLMAIALFQARCAKQDVSVLDTFDPQADAALTARATATVSPDQSRGLCLTPENNDTANGTRVLLLPCDGSATQKWMMVRSNVRLASGKCLDVVDGKIEDGARLQLWDCYKENTNQKFAMAGATLTWSGTNKCLDVGDEPLSANTPLVVSTCVAGKASQVWTLDAASSASPSSAPAAPAEVPTPTLAQPAGYLRVDGTTVRDASNKQVILRGPNIGGWLVQEGWMCGIVDGSDPAGRFTRETLERRFGEAQTQELLNSWYDQFFTTQDLDNIQAMGFNVIRVPFGWRNLQHADGSWVTDSSGKIDFTRLDWVVNEAGKRGIYVILDFHIWDTQKAQYDLISTNTEAGRSSQKRAAAIWTEVAKHFIGNTHVAAFDIINEPTGSYANILQDTLYKAVRAQDANRIIVMESVSASPQSMGWRQVMYSYHEYGMMGTDFGTNQSVYWDHYDNTLKNILSFNVPVYIGEMMAQQEGPTLPFMLLQYNSNQFAWSTWTYKAVDNGAWGLYNLPGSVRVNALSDSFTRIKQTWSQLGTAAPQTPMINAMKTATGR